MKLSCERSSLPPTRSTPRLAEGGYLRRFYARLVCLLGAACALYLGGVRTAQAEPGYYYLYFYYEDGVTVQLRTYVYEDAHGRRTYLSSTEYYPSGARHTEGSFTNGMMHGTWTVWYESGQASSQGPYANGMKAGEWTSWHENGVVSARGSYANGGKEGGWTEWHDNGVQWRQGGYRLDARDGPWTEWARDGGRASVVTYVAGVPHGACTFYHANGEVSNTGQYDGGRQQGLWVYDNEEGRRFMERTYEADVIVKQTLWSYRADGVLLLVETTQIVGDEHLRETQTYYASGQVESIENYRNEQFHGLVVSFWENGNKRDEADYKDGVIDGVSSAWHANGQLRQQSTLRMGVLASPILTWFDNGVLCAVEQYDADGRRAGTWYEWDMEGRPKRVDPYLNGVLNGVQQLWYYYERGVTAENSKVEYCSGPIYDFQPYGRWSFQTIYWDRPGVSYGARDYGPPPWPAVPGYGVPETLRRDVRGYVSHAETRLPLEGAAVKVGSNDPVLTDARGFYQTELLGVSFDAEVPVVASLDGFRTATRTVDLQTLQCAVANLPLAPATAANDGLPVITAVQSRGGSVFLEGVNVTNAYVVFVDWKGSTPGSIIFDRNGSLQAVPAVPYGGTGAFNMGRDFVPSVDPNRNYLFITAETLTGVKSPLHRLNPIVVPQPLWTAPLGAFFHYATTTRYPTYALAGTWPEPGFELLFKQEKVPGWVWSLWSRFPFVGGRQMGLKETQFSLATEFKTDGTGSVGVGGQTGFEVGGQTLLGKIKGAGKLAYVAGQGVVWTNTEASFAIEGKLEKDMGLLDLMPPVAAAAQLPLIGRVVVAWTGLAKVKGSVTVAGGATFDVATKPAVPWLTLTNGKPEFGGGVGLALSAKLNADLEAELSGGGTFKFVALPFPKVALEKVEAELAAKLALTAYSYKWEFEKKHTFAYQFDTNDVFSFALSSEARGTLADAAPAAVAGFLPMGREFLDRGPYSRFLPRPLRATTTADAAVPTGRRLIENVYPYAQPGIALRPDGWAAIAFTHFDPPDATLQATETAVILFDGETYSAPVLAENNTRAEFNPAVAFDSAGRAVCVWERVKDDRFTGTNLVDMLPQLEIVYARLDPATVAWSTPVALTDNAHLDRNPLLRRGLDGSLFLAWESNPANEMVGTTNAPTQVHFSRWDVASDRFGGVGTLPNALTNVTAFGLDWDGAEATLVWVSDLDGDLATGSDTELFRQRYDGAAWSAPRRLAGDTHADSCPRVAYRAAGAPELLWRQDTNLVRLLDWDTGAAGIVRPGSTGLTFGDFQLAAAPGGRLAVVWQDGDAQGPDLFYSLYDPAHDAWGLDQRLTQDAALERSAAIAFGADGALNLVYVRKATNDVTDLYHVTHTLQPDLVVDANGLAWTAGAGADVVLTCRVRNAGALPAAGVSVAFYRGDPQAGGLRIGTAPLVPALLRAGDVATALLNWTVPAGSGSASLYAIADADNEVVERDEGNNAAHAAYGLPDLVAVAVRVEEHGDGHVDVVATLRNDGPETVCDVPVLFHADGVDVATQLLGGILPGGQAEVMLAAQWESVLFRRLPAVLAVTVDPANVIAETDEANNTVSRYVVLSTDVDRDGMPDQWERHYFEHDVRDGQGDADHDGATDVREFRTGTNPTDPTSLLACRLGAPDGAGRVTIAWGAQLGVSYQLQYSERLGAAAWWNLGGWITATGTLCTVTDQPPPAATPRYYRVRVLTLPEAP